MLMGTIFIWRMLRFTPICGGHLFNFKAMSLEHCTGVRILAEDDTALIACRNVFSTPFSMRRYCIFPKSLMVAHITGCFSNYYTREVLIILLTMCEICLVYFNNSATDMLVTNTECHTSVSALTFCNIKQHACCTFI